MLASRLKCVQQNMADSVAVTGKVQVARCLLDAVLWQCTWQAIHSKATAMQTLLLFVGQVYMLGNRWHWSCSLLLNKPHHRV
jgi:hypothetical protein